MLDRPAIAARELRRRRQARHRERVRRGVALCQVEYSGEILDLLVRLGWLDERAAGDAQAVGDAIAALLRKPVTDTQTFCRRGYDTKNIEFPSHGGRPDPPPCRPATCAKWRRDRLRHRLLH
jgi:hypothetical protein